MESNYLLVDLFIKGGLIMWPLLLTSTLALIVALERSWFWWMTLRRRQTARVEEALALLEDGHVQAAARALEGSPDFVARALRHGLNHHHGSLQAALQTAAGSELERMGRFLPVLDTIVTLAPLLGLLGTIFGIMHSFQMMGDVQLAEPQAVTGGIAEALIATGFGLAIAIFSLIPLNFFTTRLHRAQHQLETYATHVEVLYQGREAKLQQRTSSVRPLSA